MMIAEKGKYESVCLRIFYQHCYEKKLKPIDDELLEYMFKLKNHSFKIDLLKLITVDWKLNNHETEKKLAEGVQEIVGAQPHEKDFFEMAMFLHESDTKAYEMKLVDYLANLKNNFGDFLPFIAFPDIQLLLVILERMELNKAIDFTFTHFHQMKRNSTIVDTLRRSQKHQRYVLTTDESREVRFF
jgi:hypothetical protein